MLLNEDKGFLYGVHQEPIIRQYDRCDEINERMRNRHFSGTTGLTTPVFSSLDRPMSMKYTHWSIPSNHTNYSSQAAKQVISMMPNRVNTESELRNQYEALQKADQAVYVPSSTSNLYFKTSTGEPMAPHRDVMKYEGSQGSWTQNRWTKPDPLKFNNSTKTQMRQAM
jgi:hypothetical protein